jgi:hypothetical protein
MKMISIIICIIITACAPKNPKIDNYYRVASKVNRELKTSLMLESWGIGGMMPIKIEAFNGFFTYPKALNNGEARVITLLATDIILDLFNTDKYIQEYLSTQPFSVKNLLFSIYYFNPDENLNMAVTVANETLYFDRVDSTTFKHTLIFKETYEEAVEKAGLKN